MTEQSSASGSGPANDAEQCNLIVNYLPQSMTDEQFYSVFAPCGNVQYHHVVRDKNTGYSFGYGFITMSKKDEAAAAIRDINGMSILDKRLKVSYSRPKSVDSKNTNLFVANMGIGPHLTDESFEKVFAPYGEIVNISLLKDKFSRAVRGSGFVRYAKCQSATAAISALNGTRFPGSPGPAMRVKIAEDYAKKRVMENGQPPMMMQSPHQPCNEQGGGNNMFQQGRPQLGQVQQDFSPNNNGGGGNFGPMRGNQGGMMNQRNMGGGGPGPGPMMNNSGNRFNPMGNNRNNFMGGCNDTFSPNNNNNNNNFSGPNNSGDRSFGISNNDDCNQPMNCMPMNNFRGNNNTGANDWHEEQPPFGQNNFGGGGNGSFGRNSDSFNVPMGGQGGNNMGPMGGQGGNNMGPMGGQGGNNMGPMGGQGGNNMGPMGGQGGNNMGPMNQSWGGGGNCDSQGSTGSQQRSYNNFGSGDNAGGDGCFNNAGMPMQLRPSNNSSFGNNGGGSGLVGNNNTNNQNWGPQGRQQYTPNKSNFPPMNQPMNQPPPNLNRSTMYR